MIPLVILFAYFMIVICGVAAVIFMILYFAKWEGHHEEHGDHAGKPGNH